VRNGRVGVEASLDSSFISSFDAGTIQRGSGLGAVLFYLNPDRPLKLYGLLGAGLSVEQGGGVATQAMTLQAGAGLELDLASRLSLIADVRALGDATAVVAEPTPVTTTSPSSDLPTQMGVATFGISLRF
jgi:hypothetical protein